MIKRKAKIVGIILTLCMSTSIFMSCKNNNSKVNVDLKNILTSEVKDKLLDKNWVVLDTRENDEFNGWNIDNLERGGHIKGATDFSAAWLRVDCKNKDKRLDTALKDKRISKEKNIILYDDNGKDSKEVANYLHEKGFKNLYTYNLKDWAKDKTLPMEFYKNYQLLVPACWVKDVIDGKKPQNYNGNKFKIFEVSWGDENKSSEYLKKGHIKGATHINTDDIEKGPLWNRISDKELEKFAENNGITKDTTVILYGSDSMGAFRVASLLKYMGVNDVRVLNGGTQKWIDAGYKLEKTLTKKTQVSSFGAIIPVNKQYIIDLKEAKEIVKDKNNSKLVDVRSWDEYIGKTSGYDYIKPKGRPQGSAWGHSGTNSSNLDDYRNVDNTMRNKDEILNMWKEWGIDKEQKLSFFCGTGWRAAEVFAYADVMGLEKISVYDGGWNEWSGNTGNKPNPIEVGESNNAK